MRELHSYLRREQPKINKAIERRIAELPDEARPVARHVLLAGGKRLRPLLTLLVGRALNCQEKTSELLYELGAAIEILHAATLLHDDILDNADLRRNKPAAHILYGMAPAILTGDAMLAKALHIVSSFGDARLTACVSEAVMRTAVGEMAEFAHLRDMYLSQEQYLDIITGKTAWMLRSSCELGAILSGAAEPLIQAAATFGLELGVAFQIVDDALDFFPTEKTGKPLGGDIREGKITPPLQLYIASLPEQEATCFKQRFRDNAINSAELDEVNACIYRQGYAQRTRELADSRLIAAGASLDVLPESAERMVLRQMMLYIQNRDR
ncbi:MAG: polyprenyl synthetase family protein [Desulfovibrio sp.]|jgi:octaprenyl-diphosphate synthase|nr:polyprenyl synthetase family protein [Desulfovibrio sp.]